VPDLKLSADGLFYWDGLKWVSTLSPDGRSKWNGTSWVVLPSMPATVQRGPTAPPRVATSWTKPLQYMVAIWYSLAVLSRLVDAGLVLTRRQMAMDAVNRQMAASGQPPPIDASYMVDMSLGIDIVLFLGIAALNGVILIGAIKRWTWAFWAALALNAFGLFALLPYLANFAQPGYVASWLTFLHIATNLVAIAVAVVLLIAVVTRGVWAAPRVAPWQMPPS
jgi:hypothetical protein